MKIIKLQAENFKKLKAVEITPQGNTIIISGKNGQGKSSVLDAIWAAMCGGDITKTIPEPIRKGESHARVIVDLGEYQVIRTWTANDKSYLQVENKHGARFTSPQKLLDDLVGKLSFDPLAFANDKPDEQVKTLLALAKLPIDPAALEAQKKALYDQRTLVNREAKNLEGQLAGFTTPGLEVPTEEVSATSIMAEMRAAQEQQTANDAERRELVDLGIRISLTQANVENITIEIQELYDEIKRIQDKIAKKQIEQAGLQIEARQARETQAVLVEQINALVDPDMDSFQFQLAEVEQTNKSVRDAKTYADTKKKLDAKKDESESLSSQIVAIDQQKEDALKNAQLPIDGLSFDENGVTFNGIPFVQASDAEKLRVSMAMAMALNPELRVVRITNGSLLDGDNMRLIEEMASGKDYQVWIEKVDDSGKVGIYIEDGEIIEPKETGTMNQ